MSEMSEMLELLKLLKLLMLLTMLTMLEMLVLQEFALELKRTRGVCSLAEPRNFSTSDLIQRRLFRWRHRLRARE